LPPPATSSPPSLSYPVSKFGFCRLWCGCLLLKMIPYHIINFRNLISAVVDFRTDRWHCCFKGHQV
uniref:Uncharacterized protein n=1 Tax=Triticum urartu TaxID=4572 RepID=A0A8R7Q5A4_TRIUA